MSSSPGAANPPVTVEGDLSDTVIACAVVLPFIAAVVVGLRFYVRAKLLRAVKIEDWFILAAMVFSIVYAGFVIKQARTGLGRPAVTVPAFEMLEYLKASWYGTLFYNLSLCFTKVSILLLYLRVLTHDYIRKVTWVTVGIVGIYNAWAIAMYLSMCIPLERTWDKSIDGYCHPWTVWWALTYLHIITDFMIFVIPIPVVVTMTIPRRQKAGLLIVFTMGLFVCLISVVRAILLNSLLYSPDTTWDLVVIAKWSTAEPNAAVVCGCLPTLRPLLTKVFGPLVDRVFPQQHQSLEDTTGRPRTVGSMPMNAFGFGRRSKSQNPTAPAQMETCQTRVNGGNMSVTDVEAGGSVYRRKDVDSDAELIPGVDSVVELRPGMRAPPKVLTRG